jgi:hypothetical protein
MRAIEILVYITRANSSNNNYYSYNNTFTIFVRVLIRIAELR